MPVRIISKNFILLGILLLFLLMASGCSAAPANRDFRISRYEQTVLLQPDGGAVVTETIHYKMLSRSSEFLFEIRPATDEGVRIMQVDIAAMAEGGDREKDKFLIVREGKPSDSQAGAPYYRTDRTGDRIHVRVMVLSDAGQDRTIRLTYQLEQAVLLATDTAFLVREYFINHGGADVETAVLALKIPDVVPDIQLWTLPVSRADYAVSRPSGDQIVIEGQQMAGPESVMTLYCLMPEDAFPGAQAPADSRTWNDLTSEARSADSRLDDQAMAQSTMVAIIYLLLAISILLILLIYWLFDHERANTVRVRYWRDLPDCPPAVMAVLMRRDWPGRMILSTLLDLVRRGELTLNGNVFSLVRKTSGDFEHLAAFEIYLIQWLFDNINNDTVISVAEIRRYARDRAHEGEMAVFYNQFRILIDEEIERAGLLNRRTIRRGRLTASISAAIYLVLAIAACFIMRSPSGLVLLIPAAGLVYYRSILRRLTLSGQNLFFIGQAIRRTMRDIEGKKVITDRQFYARTLPMAVAMAASDSLIRRLESESQAAGIDDPFSAFNLDAYGLSASSRTWQNQLKVLQQDLHVMESMLSSSMLFSALFKY